MIDIKAIKQAAIDSDELEKELGTAAIQLIVTLIAVACLAFGLGYIVGIN